MPGSAGGNTFDLTAGALPGIGTIHVNGGRGTNTLLWPTTTSHQWVMHGSNTGTLSGPAYPSPTQFTQVGNLTAGSLGDSFQFPEGAALTGNIDGGGTGTLDYTGYSTDVVVDLQIGFASGVAGSVSGFQNVIGASGG